MFLLKSLLNVRFIAVFIIIKIIKIKKSLLVLPKRVLLNIIYYVSFKSKFNLQQIIPLGLYLKALEGLIN